MSTYPRRPKEEAFVNAVDVVELLLVPTDQAPKYGTRISGDSDHDEYDSFNPVLLNASA